MNEHVIKLEFLSLKNRYASIKLAHAQACKKEKKEREKRHGFGSLQTQSLYFGKKKKCVSDEQSIPCTVIHMEFSLPLVLV